MHCVLTGWFSVATRQKIIRIFLCMLIKPNLIGWFSKQLSRSECWHVLVDALVVFPNMATSPFLSYRQTQTHVCLFAVCFTIIANTPLPSVHFTHDVAHLFTHLSELLSVSMCVCTSALWAVMRGRSCVDQRAKPMAYGHVLRCYGT